MTLLTLAGLLLAYLLGSLSGGLLLGRIMGKGDLRTSGSGNAGATNALRTGGSAFGIAVLLFDLAKGLLAVTVLPWLAPQLPWFAYACGAAAVIGHVWPVYFGFRGGKGAATLIGAMLFLLPLAMVPAVIVWVATLVLTGYVGLATLLGMTAVLLAALLMNSAGALAAPVAFALAMWLLVFYTHRENIQRLRAGTENRFERAMVLRR